MAEGRIIGYDLSDSSCQISFYNEELHEPETLEVSPDNFQIPLVVGNRNEIWEIGKEAKKLAILHEGELATDLLSKSIAGERITLGGISYEAVALLSRFVEMSLRDFGNISYIVFTVPRVNEDFARVLKGVAGRIGMNKDHIYVQDYRESFCNYMFYQPKELWQYEAAMFYCDKYEVRACMLKQMKTGLAANRGTFVMVEDVANAKMSELAIVYPMLHGEKAREADARFKLFCESVLDKRAVSSVYLTGEGFENNWYPDSLKVLCNGRRAFMGNNLYSKGACFTAHRRNIDQNEGLIYIDENKLVEQISLKVRMNGEDEWFPIVGWGNHWYESDHKWEILLEDTEDIEVHIESLATGEVRVEYVSLEEMPERASYSMRLQIETIFIDRSTCKIIFKDVGFGEFFPPTDFETETTIHLGGNHGQLDSLQ